MLRSVVVTDQTYRKCVCVEWKCSDKKRFTVDLILEIFATKGTEFTVIFVFGMFKRIDCGLIGIDCM